MNRDARFSLFSLWYLLLLANTKFPVIDCYTSNEGSYQLGAGKIVWNITLPRQFASYKMFEAELKMVNEVKCMQRNHEVTINREVEEPQACILSSR